MVKEIVEFIFLYFVVIDIDEIDFLDGKVSDSVDFRFIEEFVVWGMMEVYFYIFIRYLEDVVINFDFDVVFMIKYRIIEIDIIVIYFNEDWKLYL